MICFNCKTQIADNSQVCPNCGAPQSAGSQNPQAQVAQAQMQTQAAHARTYNAVKLRRIQRWVFYVIIIVIFVAMVAYMLKIYSDNTGLVESITKTQAQLKETQGNLDTTRQTLTGKDSELTQLKQSTLDNQNALNIKLQDLQKTLNSQTDSLKQLEQYKGQAMSATQVYSMISQVSSFMSSKDLARIPLVDFNLVGSSDVDKDGLSDDIEASLGTNSGKVDTDNDTFGDKAEVLGGYDPLITGKKLAVDLKFAQASKGKIVIQNDNGAGSFVWYINLKDGKRYFIGRLPDGVVSAYVPVANINSSTPAVTPKAQ